MRHLFVCAIGVFCGSSILSAGQVYGTLRDGAGKALAGKQITITSPAKTAYEGKTGADGSFQIFVKENGRCEFKVDVGGKAPATANVFSYAEPAKYEFEVVDGTLKAK
jgi:hypothetical protein